MSEESLTFSSICAGMAMIRGWGEFIEVQQHLRNDCGEMIRDNGNESNIHELKL